MDARRVFVRFKRDRGRHRGSGGRVAAAIDLAVGRQAFGWRARERLYRHLAAQAANEVTWLMAIESYHGRILRKGQRVLGRLIGEVLRAIKDGQSIASALDRWIPADEVMMIASGEQAGNLPVVLEALLNAKGKVSKVRRTVLEAVSTPAVYVAALYGLCWTIGEFLVPTIEESIPREKITGIGASLFLLGDIATGPAAAVLLLLGVAIGLLIWWSLPRWTGRGRLFAERMFPYSFYRDIHGYLWLLSFSTLLSAGQSDVGILGAQSRRASPWLRERVIAVRRRMENGVSLADALRLSKMNFPNPDMIDDIASTSGFRDFPSRIAKLANQWSNELEWRMAARVKIIGFIFNIVIYGIMGYVLVAINSMSTQMGGAPTY